MFNKNLKNIRLKQGRSQKQVAAFLNVSPQSVSKWEKGEALPSIEFLPKLAEYLNCDINAFFVPSEEAPFDLEMLKEFCVCLTEHLNDEDKGIGEIHRLLRKYPNIEVVIKDLADKIKEHQVIKTKTIQGILACSEEEASLFVQYFVKSEHLEKIEGEDSYFVVKSALDGTVTWIRVMKTTYEILEEHKSQKNTSK